LPDPQDPGLDAAIAALWQDARPRALERVAVLEAAVTALAEGALAPETADEARREAHKLAGSLGTFGLPAGTEHARAIERAFDAGAGPGDAPALAGAVAGMRTAVEAGRQGA
jgi:HPt (histidine-containing phosphotransfer) domain-containing protein